MAAGDRAVLKEPNPADGTSRHGNRTPKTPLCNVQRVKFSLSILVTFTAGCLFMLITTRQANLRWERFQVLPLSLGNLSSLVTFSRGDNQRPDGNKSINLQDDDFYHSGLFKAFVKTKNVSSVSEYLLTTNSYLLTFRSPMIRENPSQYSWPETDTEKKERKSASKTKLIVWYNPPPHVRDQVKEVQFSHCPVSDCAMSLDYKVDHARADAVVFLGAPGRVVPPRDHAKQVYIFYTMESPWLTGGSYGSTAWNTAFNWTANFRTDSDIFEAVRYLKRSPSVPSHSTLLKMKRKRTKYVAWMSSNCNVQSRRDQYVHRLRKIIPVDIYGRCGNLTCKRWARECDLLLNDYLFYLSFENSMCVDYITEKFYKTFAEGVHVLAVVRGGANYSRFFPAGTFIDAEAFPSPEELGRYLLELAEDEAGYVDRMWRRAHFVHHERGFLDAHCQLCYKLHHLERFKRTYSDMYGWYHRHGCSEPKPF